MCTGAERAELRYSVLNHTAVDELVPAAVHAGQSRFVCPQDSVSEGFLTQPVQTTARAQSVPA